ncbi:MAG: molybdopterin cofactor-binding domain-containing protein [Pseudomonadota bacterium]
MNNWTRRAFIGAGVITGGALLVGVAIRPGRRVDKLAALVEGEDETLVHAFIKIDTDNGVTVIVPHSEMGQGAQTALAQMAADELDADWEQVRIEEAPAAGEYALYTIGRGFLLKDVDLPKILIPTVDGAMMRVADSMGLQITGGSISVRVTGMYGMRVAGAATRDLLRRAAAAAWDVPSEDVETNCGQLKHAASGRTARYAEFAEAAAQLKPTYTPTFKDPSEYTIMGQSVERLDLPSKVDGSARFALDVRLPNMVYATVSQAPVFGARVASLDADDALAIDGVLAVHRLPETGFDSSIGGFDLGESVAVVASSYWLAKKGLQALSIQWTQTGHEAVSSDSLYEQFAETLSSGADVVTDTATGDVAEAGARAAYGIEATYRVPFLAHTCMEPLNATADVRDGRCELWVGCQNPLGFRHAMAAVLGLEYDDVTVHNQFMGGGFGRKARADWATQAALLSREVGRPVQLIWSREEDVRHDKYRPAGMSQFRAALDDNGRLLAWTNRYTNKMDPPDAPLIPYAIPNQDIGSIASPTHVPTGAWRSVDHSQHGFFTESFIDEVAIAAGRDPFEYREQLLSEHPRHLAVLQKAARAASWGSPMGPGRGRGIALQESFGTIVAQVIEVTVNNGAVAVDRVVAAVDIGFAISPDGTRAQIESGVLYGLTAALYGDITIENGAVKQSNFHDYRAVRMSESPKIETHIINSGYAPGGAGEVGTPAVAPALANAVFNATGVRVRELPLSKATVMLSDTDAA